MIGYLGDIVFEVSLEKARTFRGFSRKTTGRWATHNLHGKKPELEFSGPDVAEIRFSMRLDAFYGVDPGAETDRILRAVAEGVVLPLSLADEYRGDFVITEVTEEWRHVDNRGRVIVSDLTIRIKEYADNEPGN